MTEARVIRFILVGALALFGISLIFGSSPPSSLALQQATATSTRTATPSTPEADSGQSTTASQRQRGPVILLNPFAGPSASPVTVTGQNWPPGQRLIVYLVVDGQEFAVASAVPDAQGAFTVSFFIPPSLADEQTLTVLARTLDDEVSALAFYNVSDASPEPVPTPAPAEPQGVVTANRLNVRSGPGTVYPVVGQVELGQTVDINGTNVGWWRINYLHSLGDFGWVSGTFINAENTEDVPLVQAPPRPPPTPTPVPTPTPQQPTYQCNPGQWSGCNPSFCPREHVSQCQANGTWGQCLWDPGTCSDYIIGGGGGDDDDDDDDNDNDDDDDNNDNDDDDDNNDNDDDDDNNDNFDDDDDNDNNDNDDDDDIGPIRQPNPAPPGPVRQP